MSQQGFGPPSLPVGTEVSAKYRGAFCEAKVKSVVRVVKCRVVVKDGQSSIFVNDEEIKGSVKLGAVVEVKHPETGQFVEATINKLIDHSSYTVVFDDGDERTLRRSQLCLKGDKHFIESETLDNLPLSHPEHFGTPVLQNKKAKRKHEDESDEEVETSEEESPRRATYRGRHQELVGKLMLVDLPQKKGTLIPALVVLPDANSLNEVKSRDQILVRSFKDSKFMVVTRKDLKDFSRAAVIKIEDKTLRTAIEKALLYFDTKELPVGWNKDEMLGSDLDDDEEGEEENEYASEDEPFEEKDRFVAQLYKFMDDRGTPINKGPCIGNKDLNLYKLFKIVQNLGGYNKVTKEMKWAVVYSKMGLPSLHQNPAHQIKTAYKKYLDAYETFYRKLGSTMGTLSRPGRARQNSSRSILNFRGRERSPRSPKPPEKSKDDSEAPKRKPDTSPEKIEDETEATTSAIDENDVVTRRTPRRDTKTQLVKDENKEKKEETVKNNKEDKKEELSKVKKEDKKDEKGKKNTPVPAVKVKEDKVKDDNKKEDKKPVRKLKGDDESEKEDKKTEKISKKDEDKKVEVKTEMSPNVTTEKEIPKKRVTRRKLLPNDLNKTEFETKEEEEKKELPKKMPAKVVEKPLDKKDIPKTLERREKSTEKRESIPKKEMKVGEKKPKSADEKKIKKEKKAKDDNTDEASETNKIILASTNSEDEEETETDKVVADPKLDFPIGSKLRVKYGRGKNQKIYIAKVVDFGKDGVHKTYLVHYAGWNTRYDEWIRPDRVVSVLDKPSDGGENKNKTPHSRPPKLLKSLNQTHMKGASQVFRTPKLSGAKTRATRSSSSDTSVVSKSDKMVTRRRSIMADSTGSISPESQNSSDVEDNTGSERADDEDDNTKSEKEDEEDILNVDEEFEDETEGEKFTDPDTSVEDTDSALKITSSDPESERLDNEEMEGQAPVKEIVDSESSEDMSTDGSKTTIELRGESKDKVESTKMAIEPCKKSSVHDAKPERASVIVSEINHAVDEIRSVYEDVTTKEEPVEDNTDSIDMLATVTERQEFKVTEDINIEENSELQEEKNREEGLTEQPVQQNLNDESTISKLDFSFEEEKKDIEKPKLSRGRKKEIVSKDMKKPLKNDISGPALPSETSDQSVPVADKTEPSPYDFDGDADVPVWHPEITKKWEPSSKVQIKDPTSDEGDEKKKVKKKVKRKVVAEVEIVEENDMASTPSIKEDSQNSSISADSDKTSSRKKGRKKKELMNETKKEVIEQYESTVNSVVEAVKHSLLDTETEHEPNIKRRRVKRVSESDKRENMVRVNKMGRKVASRDCLDSSPSVDGDDKELVVNSNTDSCRVIETAGSSVLSAADVEGTSGVKNRRKESSFSESQGFEPQAEQETSAPFDNTPPTTPEHDEETNSSVQQSHFNSSDLNSKLDLSKPMTTSLSSSLTAPCSTLAPSKSASESPSDNDVTSTASTDNFDSLPVPTAQSESSGTDQDVPAKRRKVIEETASGPGSAKKKKRIHGTRSRTAQKSPKYVGNSDSQGSASNTPNHCPDSPTNKFPDMSKSPRPSKFNFSADLGEYLEGEARCNFLISKMREIKSIYMNLKAEVASIDRRRKRAKRKERESSQISVSEKEPST